jgi:hypothetical protein
MLTCLDDSSSRWGIDGLKVRKHENCPRNTLAPFPWATTEVAARANERAAMPKDLRLVNIFLLFGRLRKNVVVNECLEFERVVEDVRRGACSLNTRTGQGNFRKRRFRGVPNFTKKGPCNVLLFSRANAVA